MNDPHYYCVIMAGGLGTRFWPVSRDSRPKQFLTITKTGKSFLRLAYERARTVADPSNIIVVTLERYRSLVLSDIPELELQNLLMEPYNRNTASCIAFASYTIMKRDPEAVMLVMPADQVVEDGPLFTSTVLEGMNYAAGADVLLTLGILPRRPDPNFGYIQIDGQMSDGHPVRVKTFTEKPSRELAQVFVDSGEFLWNSGMFIWKAGVIAEELARYAPEVARQWNGWELFVGGENEHEYLQRIYADMPRTSIDYAVMEKSERVMAIPAFFGWNDLGNWDSVYEYYAGSDGNAVKASCDVILRDSNRTVVASPQKNKLLVVKGLEDYIVFDSEDILMICPRDGKSIGDLLSEITLPEYEKYR
ncbi:MAG: mannose-1-phosphate guanylyltransferase [Bacteroidales bacterium]|nr:mannose-1-phosphate guanylyltransferase [Bacteroidales bacterium]